MATNHNALYCAISFDRTRYKIGMTQQTKRARECGHFVIVSYADFYNLRKLEWCRDMLFEMEDYLRELMSKYYRRDESTNDWFFVDDYNIFLFERRFEEWIQKVVNKFSKYWSMARFIDDCSSSVERKLEQNSWRLQYKNMSEYITEWANGDSQSHS